MNGNYPFFWGGGSSNRKTNLTLFIDDYDLEKIFIVR